MKKSKDSIGDKLTNIRLHAFLLNCESNKGKKNTHRPRYFR